MTIPDVTLAVFTLLNSVRFLAYLPQIVRAIRDTSGAESISFGTWTLFLVSHASAMAYAIENLGDWKMATLFLSNAVGSGAVLLIAMWKRSRHPGARRGPDRNKIACSSNRMRRLATSIRVRVGQNERPLGSRSA